MGKQKSKFMMIAYGCLILGAVVLLLFYTQFIRSLNDRVQSQELEHASVSANYKRLQAELTEKYGKQDASKLRDLQNRLPIYADTSRMVRVLAALEAETGLEIRSITFGAETTQTDEQVKADTLLEMLKKGFAQNKEFKSQDNIPLPAVNFKVQFTGTLTQLHEFLQRIRLMERIIVVEGFDYRYKVDLDTLMDLELPVAVDKIQGEVSLKALYADQFSPYIPESMVVIHK